MNGWTVLILAAILAFVAVLSGVVKDFWHSAFFPAWIIVIVVGLIFPPFSIILMALTLIYVMYKGGAAWLFSWVSNQTGGSR